MIQTLFRFHIQVQKILALQIRNQISLNPPIKINNEIVLNPRAYDGAVFEIIPGTDNFAFRQNPIHGGTLIAQFYSSTK